LNWGWLGWVALVPLLSLVQRPERKGVYWWAWLCGLAFAVPALQWIRLASLPMYATWAGLAVFISLHFLLFAWITRQLTLAARLPLLLVAPVVWVALEYARAHVGIGFAWYYLGHTQHDFLPLIQVADVAGAYGISFLVMMANVVLFQWLQWLSERRASRSLWIASLSVASLLAGTLVYGYWRLGQHDFEEGPRLALLQGNLPQDIRSDPNEEDTTREHFRALARQAVRARPDLVVWSETSYIRSPETPLHVDLSSLGRAAHLLGVNLAVEEGEQVRLYNSAMLFDDGARLIDRYDKMYRVPFGEYVPWEEALPFMRWFTPYENDYSIRAGERLTVFPVPGTPYRFSALICYEDTVPHLATEFLRAGVGGKRPDFFVNISNDGWFKGSAEHEQHLV
ncbi:MAG: apolipoprotein N-acyltransferase, partial [Acidobacteria bacterium]|nr:apolipoprotein N-acyltransferase [Acidobacteriota bacterium]